MAVQGSQAQAYVAGNPAQAKLPLLPLDQKRPLTSILDGFLESSADETCGLWGDSKSDFSIYDVKEILGRVEPPQTGERYAGGRNLPQLSCEPRALKAVRRACCVYHCKQDSDSTCPICLEGLLGGQTVWKLPCLHEVHHRCASHYFGANGVKPRCPHCRHNLSCHRPIISGPQ